MFPWKFTNGKQLRYLQTSMNEAKKKILYQKANWS